MTDSRPLLKALRAYERAEQHGVMCEECEDYPCDTGMELYHAAVLARRNAVVERTWSNRALALRADGYPLASRD